MAINIIKKTGTANTNRCPNRNIKYIVVHYTAGSTSRTGAARNTAVMFSSPSHGGSADFIVDDTEIVQYSPDIENYLCWHAGVDYSGGTAEFHGKCTNANSIGIEICSTNPNWNQFDRANSPKWSFTAAAVARAAELVKYLMEKYKIPAANVIRHWDVCHKECPGIIGWNPNSGSEAKWLEFKKTIGSTTTSTVKPATTTAKTDKPVNTPIYRVRKSANDAKSQIGAFTVLANAKKLADSHAGYSVYDGTGKLVYSPGAKKKTVTELAREVIAGKWGNGADRKNRLTAAGYDYGAVQAEVNRILR